MMGKTVRCGDRYVILITPCKGGDQDILEIDDHFMCDSCTRKQISDLYTGMKHAFRRDIMSNYRGMTEVDYFKTLRSDPLKLHGMLSAYGREPQ